MRTAPPRCWCRQVVFSILRLVSRPPAAGSTTGASAGRGRPGAPDLINGHLPAGRWTCSITDVEAAYVPTDPADIRCLIWDDWVQLTAALRLALGSVAACWMSGSFFTTKPVPGDLDCLYIVDHARLAAVSDPGFLGFIDDVARSRLKNPPYSLRIDSYILEWNPTPGTNPTPEGVQYSTLRGYWDDLWSRIKDTDPSVERQPRRGYLEVTVDGYN